MVAHASPFRGDRGSYLAWPERIAWEQPVGKPDVMACIIAIIDAFEMCGTGLFLCFEYSNSHVDLSRLDSGYL